MKKRVGSYPRARTEGGSLVVASQTSGVLLVWEVRETYLNTTPASSTEYVASFKEGRSRRALPA